jgi:hypothetical protein
VSRTLVAFGLFVTATVSAQLPPPVPVAIARSAGAIAIDGDLTDTGWHGAATIDRFYETTPGDNVPPPVATRALLTYDAAAFYVAIDARHPEARTIAAPFVTRDAIGQTDHYVAIYLDTRNDRRSAIELRVNPRGVQSDAIYDDASNSEDFSPDFFFDSAARIGADGWTAELRIPFSSLRYGYDDPQTWGVLIARNDPSGQYRRYFVSAPIPRQSTCLICHAQSLTGLAGLPRTGHLVIAPYVASTASEPRGNIDTSAGADVKWSPSAGLTIDLTLNPDFSQVEADVPQITTNQRFALSVPEKRPFFLEGFDLFNLPLRVVHTRTITSPNWGARATGKAGRTAYTLLVADDRGGGTVILPGPQGSSEVQDDAGSKVVIGRVRHDVGASFVGAVATIRQRDGGGSNRLLGPDFQWRPTDHDALTGQLLRSETSDRNGGRSAWAGSLDYSRQVERFDLELTARDVGPSFRADDGFIPQAGYRHYEWNGGLRIFPKRGFFTFLRPYVWGQQEEGRDGRVLFHNFYPGLYYEGPHNISGGLVIDPREQVLAGDRLLSTTTLRASFSVDPAGRLAHFEAAAGFGDYVDFADRRTRRGWTGRLAATLRPTDRLELLLNANAQSIGDARIGRIRATFSFSQRASVRAIAQYSTESRAFLGNLVYTFRWNWQTVLLAGVGDERKQRSAFVKVSYAFQR